MARKTVVTLVDDLDDLDGSEASETVNFAVDGTEYEIDLNDQHATELREGLTRYTGAARRTSGGRRTARKTTGNEAKDIRAWALSNGIQVNARGRIQADVVEKYWATR